METLFHLVDSADKTI